MDSIRNYVIDEVQSDASKEKNPENVFTTYSPRQEENSFSTIGLSEKSKQLLVDDLARSFDLDEKKLRLKTDIYVLIPFFILYYIANINRTHFGILSWNGIIEELNITYIQFFISIAVFYFPYVICQFLSNFVLRSVRPHFYISISVLLYGAAVFATGFTKTYGAYVACEFLHGLFQSGCDSSIFYITASYYTRGESQSRIAFVYSAVPLAIMTNSFISYGLQIHYNDTWAYQPWSYLLIIAGALTLLSAFALFFFIPDFPEGNRFLSDPETLFIVKKLEIYQGKSGYNIPFTVKDITNGLKDPQILSATLAAHLMGAVMFGYSFLEPKSFIVEYNGPEGVVHSTWPWFATFFAANILAFVSSKMGCHWPVILFCYILTIVGTMVLSFTSHKFTYHTAPLILFRYASNFFVSIGAWTAFPQLISWAVFNLNGHVRKSVVTSLMLSLCDLSGVYTSFALKESVWEEGTYAGTAFVWASVVMVFVYIYFLRKANREKLTLEYREKWEQLSEREKIVAGDLHPDFEYLY